MLKKFKSLILNDQVFYSLLIILVAGLSFWLGRISLEPTQLVDSRVQIIPIPNEQSNTISDEASNIKSFSTEANPSNIVVVGSRSGSKYHLPSCPGAKQIKPANIITFSSIASAEAAGYKPAANCPQLQ